MHDLLLGRPRLVLAIAAALAALAVLAGGSVADSLKTGRDNFEDRSSESARGQATLTRALGRSPEADVVVVVRSPSRARVAAVVRDLRAFPEVRATVTPPDEVPGRPALVLASFAAIEAQQAQDVAVALAERVGARPGVTVGGPVLTTAQIRDQVSEDLKRAELLALPLLLLLSLLVFRGLVAALLPVVVGVLAILGTLLGLRIATELGDLSLFALNLVTALGLGLAIDYALFILTRFREEAAVRGHGVEAVRRTLETAGRTVLFSSATVALALLALLAFPQRFLTSMAVGGAMVSLIAGIVAVTVLPALLVLLGPRVDALRFGRRRPASSSGRWSRLGRRVTARPGVLALAACAVLLVVASPVTDVRFTGFDATVLPADATSRQVADTLDREFGADRTVPVVLAIGSAEPAVAAEVRRRAAAVPGVAAAGEPSVAGTAVQRLDLLLREGPLAASTEGVLLDLDDRLQGLPVEVTGQGARFWDAQHALEDRLPVALLVLAATTVLVLLLMTGSVVVPALALLLNALTVAVTLGVLKLVFQDGRLEGALGYTSQGGLDAAQMVLLAVLTFALSTDYGVFLLGRIRELRDAGHAPDEAIRRGLAATGPLITAAAALFCVAIGAFATSEVLFIKQVGIGAAVAVAVDATLVRGVLLPAALALLGDRAWWSPPLVRRLHGRVGLAGAA